MKLLEAYAFCREIAKREAKNFYYSFRVLPAAKSDAMCAVYAFMRRADDLADDESKTVPQRRAEMATWLESWRAARANGGGDDPVFVALTDTQRRFRVSDDLLEDLVRGTTMDLEDRPAGVTMISLEASGGVAEFQVYEDFASLYRYCYLVASVVGLVCIRIFGYSDPAAEEYAEETGIAFQLTNILRDVQEDVARGRIYLPLDDMEAQGTTPGQLVRATQSTSADEQVGRLMRHEGERAEQYYAAAQRLLPLIDADSRAALWVMVTIYHELARKLAAEKYPVSGRRVRVSTAKKLLILGQGYLMSRRLRGRA